MNLLKKLGIFLTGLTFILLVLNFAFLDFSKGFSPITEQTVKGESAQANKNTTTLVISLNEQKKSYDLTDQIGKSVLEVMKNFIGNLETKGEGINAFVTGIDGRIADSSKREFWELRVNNQTATVGAGSYLIKEGDIIEWKIGTY